LFAVFWLSDTTLKHSLMKRADDAGRKVIPSLHADRMQWLEVHFF